MKRTKVSSIKNTLYFLDLDIADGSWVAEVFTSQEAVKKALFDFARSHGLESELPIDIDYEDTIWAFSNHMSFHLQKVDDESFERLKSFFS